jgi:hypothetical protein
MTALAAVRCLALWSAVGCALFSIFVVVAFRTGLVHTARRQDGTLKRRIPLRGALAMLIIPIAILLLQLAGNYLGLARRGLSFAFGPLYLLNLVHYLILLLYDTLVIDGVVLAKWRPSFLNLRDDMGRDSMGRHMLISIPIGTIFGAVIALITTRLSLTFLFRS